MAFIRDIEDATCRSNMHSGVIMDGLWPMTVAFCRSRYRIGQYPRNTHIQAVSK
ncbi:MAG: hypothetical protein ACUVT7_04175 [Thermoplasmata archaeon]